MIPPPPHSRRGLGLPARGGLTLLAAVAGLGLAGVTGTAKGPYIVARPLVVDPNTAPRGVLGALPKMGPAMVGRIVAARDEAPFRSLDDLDARVRGIGPATIAALRPHLRIEPTETRVARNGP